LSGLEDDLVHAASLQAIAKPCCGYSSGAEALSFWGFYVGAKAPTPENGDFAKASSQASPQTDERHAGKSARATSGRGYPAPTGASMAGERLEKLASKFITVPPIDVKAIE
jgi:hypothetical protein